MTAAVCALTALTLLLGAAASSAKAQDNFGIDSYITPFPKDDVYRIRLIGDSLAAGLQYVLPESLGKDPRVRVNDKRWTFKRISSTYFESNLKELRSGVYRTDMNVAVIMVGAWDRRNMRNEDGRRVRKGTGDWRREYARRIDKMMKTLKAAKVAVYWVGLPPFRRGDANADVQVINEIVRERAYLNGIRFIDAYASFVSEEGGYSAYGPDLAGKIRLLRERDGIHLSYAGNQKLAHYIERAVMRDLELARKERAIPLDGDPEEQAAIRRLQAAEKPPEATDTIGWLSGLTGSQTSQTEDGVRGDGGGYLGGGRGGEQKAENSRINLTTVDPTGQEQIISIDIVRPAIPASVVALVTRKQREDKLTPMGDTLVDQISDGINIMSSVTPADQLLTGNRRLSPAQTPFFRVLVKGERVAPRPGRADDISWPRPQPEKRQRLTRSIAPKNANTSRRPGGPIDFGKEDAGDDGVPLPGANPFRPRA